jgi:peptidylprolyl isomerase
MRLGSDLPAVEQVRLQALRTDSPSFARVAEARRNRRDAFYATPQGGVDVCDVPLPIRPMP